MFYGYQSSIIHSFMDIHLDILGFVWISMHWLALDSRSRACEYFRKKVVLFLLYDLYFFET